MSNWKGGGVCIDKEKHKTHTYYSFFAWTSGFILEKKKDQQSSHVKTKNLEFNTDVIEAEKRRSYLQIHFCYYSSTDTIHLQTTVPKKYMRKQEY